MGFEAREQVVVVIELGKQGWETAFSNSRNRIGKSVSGSDNDSFQLDTYKHKMRPAIVVDLSD